MNCRHLDSFKNTGAPVLQPNQHRATGREVCGRLARCAIPSLHCQGADALVSDF